MSLVNLPTRTIFQHERKKFGGKNQSCQYQSCPLFVMIDK